MIELCCWQLHLDCLMARQNLLLHALHILIIKTVFRPLCEVHRQIAYYDSRKWVNLKSNLLIADKYLHNQNPSLGHGKKEELCYDCLEKQWVPIMCSQFHLRWSGKSCPIHSGDGIAIPMRKDWWPPWIPTDLLFPVTLFSSVRSSDCDKFASKFQPKCLSPYSIQPKDSRIFWRTTAWTNCQKAAQTCE